MGNWRTVTITGSIGVQDVAAARRYIELGNDPANWGGFHCLCWPGPSLCGLGRWIPPAGGKIRAVGNLAERNYDINDVAEALRHMVTLAPSLELKVHCGGDYESDTCVATVTVHAGEVSVGPAEVPTVGEGLADLSVARLGAILGGWS